MEEILCQQKMTNKDRAVKSLSLILPMYNEQDVVFPLVKRLIPVLWKLRRRWQIQLILVNDGSVDDTQALIEKHFSILPWAETVILEHESNRGLGAAMATGFAAATGDVVCTLDADCTYSPEKIEALIDCLEKTDCDIVTASPYHPAAQDPSASKWRVFLSRGASWMYMMLAPTPLYCYTSFFRVYRREWTDRRFFNAPDFLAVTEILLLAACAGARVEEFPLRLGLRAYGRSKMHLARSVCNHLRLMSRILIMRFQGRKGFREQSA